MSTCAAFTSKKQPCSKTGSYPSGGKKYCYAHCPAADKPAQPNSKSGTKKAPSKPSADEIDDDVIDDINDFSSGTATAASFVETCDLSDPSYYNLHPVNITGIYFMGKNFMNAEHAYHFMKFYYPPESKHATKLLEIAKQIFLARSMSAVRSIAEKNSSYVLKKWDLNRDSSPTYSDLVLFSILLDSTKEENSHGSRIASITTDFSDTDSLVTRYVPNYPETLKVLSNYLRRS